MRSPRSGSSCRKSRTCRRLLAGAVALVGGGSAEASELVTRDGTNVRLRVNAGGIALVEYDAPGVGRRHVLYWNGVDADVRFAGRDRSGGAVSGVADWRKFVNACRPYLGPRPRWVIRACTAPDGSHWFLQAWRRLKLPFGGVTAPRELRLSHFTGEPGVLWAKVDWSDRGRYHHAYGQLTFHGRPAVPGRTSRDGRVLDRIGRNVLLDSFDSDFGPGWRRVNGFIANRPNGQFCYRLNPKSTGPPDKTGRSRADRYRLSVPGPGLSPDLSITVLPLAPTYDAELDAAANAEQASLAGTPPVGSCAHGA